MKKQLTAGMSQWFLYERSDNGAPQTKLEGHLNSLLFLDHVVMPKVIMSNSRKKVTFDGKLKGCILVVLSAEMFCYEH